MSASAEMRRALLAATLLTCATTSAFALDVNSFRAQHRLPPLSHSAALAGAAEGFAEMQGRSGKA